MQTIGIAARAGMAVVVALSAAVGQAVAAGAGGGTARGATTAIRTSDFLNSIGVNTTFPNRGQPIEKTIEMVNYVGFRWVRGGIEGLTEKGPTTVETYLALHKRTGVLFSWGLVSGGTDLEKLIATGKRIAAAGALLAFEGNNEPNNWGVTYKGETGGGRAASWMAVARLQRDLYAAVKSDPALAKYPVWSISENGAERDNVGLQFLTIPKGAGTLMPDGTKYADYAVCLHNLTTILADKGAIQAPGKLAYSIAPRPATVHDMLLQRSDGAFQLVIWGERVKGADKVSVDLGGTHASVKVYDPTAGTDPVATHSSVSSLKLTLSDHPLIVTIPARAAR